MQMTDHVRHAERSAPTAGKLIRMRDAGMFLAGFATAVIAGWVFAYWALGGMNRIETEIMKDRE